VPHRRISERKNVRLVVAPLDEPPFAVDAIALEEDTWLVLSADPEFRPVAEHPIRVHTAVWQAEPAVPGSVVVRQGRPLELLAVVHDLAQDPTWREEWVGQALQRVLREAERRTIAALGLPILGSLHGAMSAAGFLARLEEAIAAVSPDSLPRIWLQVSRKVEAEVRELLRAPER
jgi:hypothetical protein